MTSSSSRGVPPSRHTPYIKRLKNFFSSSGANSTPNRRDFTSNASLINSTPNQYIPNPNPELANPSSRNYQGNSGSGSNGPRIRNNSYIQSSPNPSSSSSYGPTSYAPDYRQGGYYNNSSWRKPVGGGSGDSRLSTSTSKYRSSLTNSVPQNKPRYDSWSNYTNPNKVPLLNNRSTYSQHPKDRRRESSGSLMNSTKVNDTYYPNRSLSYPKTVDRYKGGYYHEKKRISSTGSLPPKDNAPNFRKYDDNSSSFERKNEHVNDQNEDEEIERNENREEDEDQKEDEDDFEDEDEEESEGEVETDNVDKLPIVKPESEKPSVPHENGKVELQSSNEICYPEGCLYPQKKTDTRFEELMKEFQEKTIHNDTRLKYSLAKPVTNLSDFPFWDRNFDKYFVEGNILRKSLLNKQNQISRKKVALWKEYLAKNEIWNQEKNKMDQQLQILHPADDEMRREIESSDLKKQTQTQDQPEISSEDPPLSSRRSRRHGDSVTTEAEFQEILENLSREQDEDPLVRAERLSASIPDMILDPVERLNFKFMDSNNIVKDRTQWSERVKSDFFDNFSEKEHELFSEGFCLFPKRFGAISRHMGGLRSASDCVIHYYVTKKAVNYKQMLALFKKKSSKKRGRGKPGRSRNISQSQTPVSTPINDDSSSSFMEINLDSIPQDAIAAVAADALLEEEQYTDLGRKKRAAAPEFKEMENNLPKKKPKKRKEDVTENSDDVLSSDKSLEKEMDLQVQNPENQEDDKEKDDESNQLSSGENNDNDQREKRKTISSYWSITEANQFPELLHKHGTKWTTIADELATKSATMVRNYFQRNFEKNDWNRIAEEANLRIKAKFAAVLNQDDNVSSPPLSNGQPLTNGPPSIPIGTFQHPAPFHNPQLPELVAHIPTVKVNINSLLSDSPIKPPAEDSVFHPQAPIPVPTTNEISNKLEPIVKYTPVRSSIMSLLNSELPVKHEPIQHHSNNLKDLLNSPSVSSGSSSGSGVNSSNGKHNLANLLSEEPNV